MRRVARTLARRIAAGPLIVVRYAAILFLSGLALGAAQPPLAQAQVAAIERAGTRGQIAAHITEASQRFGIPADWIRAVMRAESAGDVRAISSKGAMGLMQIMPGTWAELRLRYRLGRDPYDPRDNILAGTAYLRELFDRYGSPGFLAAYNAGPGRYEQYLGGRPLPAETRAYVAALVPSFGGGEGARRVTVAAADPHAWTRAPLFVPRFNDVSVASSLQSQTPHDGAPDAPRTSAVDAVPPSSAGLFVARPTGEEPR
jgi:soluble lytic murein transglycosylase-like protein